MQKETTDTLADRGVQDLRSDLDLGLRMVEGLLRIGEVGAAVRLTEELRDITANTLDDRRGLRTRTTRSRRAIAGAAMAAAIGIGGLAAAGVAPVLDEPDVRRPSRQAPAGAGPGTVARLAPNGIIGVSPETGRPSSARPASPAGEVTGVGPAAGEVAHPSEPPAPEILPSPELPELPPPPQPGDLSPLSDSPN